MKRTNPFWRLIDAIVADLDQRRQPITTAECRAELTSRLLRQVGVSIYMTVETFAGAMLKGYFQQRDEGRRVWEAVTALDAHGREYTRWVRASEMNTIRAENNLVLNREIEAAFRRANDRRQSDLERLREVDPTGDHLVMADLRLFDTDTLEVPT